MNPAKVRRSFRLLRFQYPTWFRLLEPAFQELYYELNPYSEYSLRWFIELLYSAAVNNKLKKLKIKGGN